MASLVDVNVLVALLHDQHCHSPEAVRWLDQKMAGEVVICRVAQMGALRLLTQPAVMKEAVLSTPEFWRGWRALREDERFIQVGEPEGFEMVWRSITESLPKGQTAGTDIYFAAFALSGGWTLATFDRGFSRFTKLKIEFLS